MTRFAVAALLLTCGAIIVDGDLLQLAGMIKKVTKKSAIPHYSTYGCYCGLGGKGRPLDETDRCCHSHDCCYGRLETQGCKPQTDAYRHTFRNGKVACSVGKPWWWWGNAASTQCGQKACECDQKFVQCLKRNLHGYSKALQFYPNFLCFGLTPRCRT